MAQLRKAGHAALFAGGCVRDMLLGLEPGDIVAEGFARVSSPGRLDILRRNPAIIVDAAHNPHGARALAEALEQSFDFARLVGVVGILADKDARGILIALEPVLDSIVVTAPRSPCSKLEIARSVVVLPAPLPPSNDTMLPSGTLSETPLSTKMTWL